MYVCVCNAYRDAEISGAARAGVRCARRAYSLLGAGPRCGRCLPTAQALIDRIHAGEPADGGGVRYGARRPDRGLECSTGLP